jgi:hypothetical protein
MAEMRNDPEQYVQTHKKMTGKSYFWHLTPLGNSTIILLGETDKPY